MADESVPTTLRPGAVDVSRGPAWLTEGFGFFRMDALPWIGATILLFVITVGLAFVPLLGNLAGQVLWPVFIAGMMLGCHTRAQGGEFQVVHLFAGFSQNTGQLIVLGLLYLAGFIVLAFLLAIVVLFGAGGTALLDVFYTGDISVLENNAEYILLLLLVTAALFVPLLMAFWFAPALVILRNTSAVEAVKLSFNGCLQNILPFLLYGIVGLVLTIAAVIPMGLGLLILMPVITASIYAAYRDIYPAS